MWQVRRNRRALARRDEGPEPVGPHVVLAYCPRVRAIVADRNEESAARTEHRRLGERRAGPQCSPSPLSFGSNDGLPGATRGGIPYIEPQIWHSAYGVSACLIGCSGASIRRSTFSGEGPGGGWRKEQG